ncbi:hypothetical protein MYU51_002481 [Penicillium brevicompactum]|uniref:uncharacterized protein n=1 Tax=Penicillium brevicompactum TaxID=5074 RepID=UPI0025406976|nr:uncharacterized protein N7506_003016 [Penicillium brevicompactum]KAJ5343192.1 hypothetical protein N7506_003016 [Penicillium brevicompactum]
MPTKVSILIFVGDPLDYTKYRHTALFFEFPSGSTCAMHIEGGPGFFEFQPMDNYQPDQSRRLAERVMVAELHDSISEISIKGVVSRTPVKNGRGDVDWNCQNWVGDALTRMVNNGLLNASQRASAIDKMTDACLEAGDE